MIKSDDLLNFINKKLLSEKNLKAEKSTLLFKDRYLDSVTILSLIGYIEKELGRTLKDEEILLDNFASIDAIVTTFTL